MKKFLKISVTALLCLIIALCAVSCGGSSVDSASGECGSGMSWEFDSKTNVLSISGNGKISDYESAENLPWAAVKSAVKTITVSDGVEAIGNKAFYGFSALESITLPETVASIGDSSFAFCTVLKSISLPDALTTIGASAFEGCSALESAFVPESVTKLGERAFAYCYSMTDAAILAKVEIPENTFLNCRSIDRIILHPEIETISENAFKGSSVTSDDAVRTDTTKATVTVKYVDTEGNEISEAVTQEKEYGDPYSIVSPAIEGYTADKLTVSGKLYGDNKTVTVTYTKDEVVETTEPAPVEKEPIGPSTIIAIVVLGVVLVGIAVGAILIFRSEKKNANKTGTVRKNTSNDNNKKRR